MKIINSRFNIRFVGGFLDSLVDAFDLARNEDGLGHGLEKFAFDELQPLGGRGNQPRLEAGFGRGSVGGVKARNEEGLLLLLLVAGLADDLDLAVDKGQPDFRNVDHLT